MEEGSLPADTLQEDDDDDSEVRNVAKDSERTSTKYSYTLFHVIFFLIITWVATLLTMKIKESTNDGELDGFTPVGRTYWASWVKIISAWVSYGIYTWSLVTPMVLPDRFDFL